MLIGVVPKWLSLTSAIVCRFAVAGVYAVAFLYSSEVFPTVRDIVLCDYNL